MGDVRIAYGGVLIAEMDAQGTKTLHTSGKYCKNNIQVAYTPPSGGAVLPVLKSPGTAGDLMEGKQLIDGAGRVVDGTFTIAPELAEQAALIDEIRVAVQSKTVAAPVIEALEITENGAYTAPEGVDRYSPISVNVPVPEGYVKPEGKLEITENGEHDVAAYARVNVNVESGGASELPTGYRRADYIQFTGSQFVDTGIIGNQDTRIRVAFAWNDAIQRHIYGCVSADNTASITSYMNGSWRFGTKSATKTVAKNNPDMLYIGEVSRTRIAITGSSTAISDVEDFETVGTLLLGGARDSDGSLPSVGINGKVAEFRIWSAGDLVLHLVPVTDGTAFRFWDVVGRKFHDSITDTPLSGGNW